MNKKTIVGGLVAAAVISGGSFYCGTLYAPSKAPSGGQFAQFGRSARGRFGGQGGAFAGAILSKDASGITIKMQDGNTKIVLVGASAQVMKTVPGSAADLSTGTNVMVTGTPNSDGSVTAQSIQIRPAVTGAQQPTGAPRAQ